MQVLVVCTANIARSPLAEAMLARVAGDQVTVVSAGTRAREGYPAAPESQQLAAARGLDLGNHRSKPVAVDTVTASDLIVTMSERQRDAIAPLAPRLAGRLFTLREFDRLGGAIDEAARPDGSSADRLLWLRDEAHRARPIAPRPNGSEDVRDPMGRPIESWERAARLLDGIFERLEARLHG